MNNPLVVDVLQSTTGCKDGDCRNCDKRGLLIQPLRLSAFCSDDEAANANAPALGHDEIVLSASRYCARLPRESYIYVLVHRPGLVHWQAYYVRPGGHLETFPVDDPPPRRTAEVACSRMAEAADAMLIAIQDADEVDHSYWLLTPDPLSSDKLEEYRNNAERFAGEGKMHHFSPKQWIQSRTGEQYVMDADAMRQYTLEYVALAENDAARGDLPPYLVSTPLIQALEQQAFPPLSDPLAGSSSTSGLPQLLTGQNPSSALIDAAGRLGRVHETLRDTGGAAILLRDPLGITQELNAWRNAAMEGMEPWMRTRDGHGADNEWKLLTAMRLADVREGLCEQRIQEVDTSIDRPLHGEPADNLLEHLHPDPNRRAREAYIRAAMARLRFDSDQFTERPRIEQEAWRRYPDPNRQARDEARERMRQTHRSVIGEDRIDERKQDAADRLVARFNSQLDGTDAQIIADFNREAAPWMETMRARAPDHLAWLQSSDVIAGLHAYDPQDWQRGWAFAMQTSLAMIGMEATEAGQAVLDGWWNDTGIPDTNLAWRTYGLNHARLIADTRQALVEAHAQAQAGDAALDVGAVLEGGTGAAAAVLKAFDEANRALESVEQAGRVGWFRRGLLGGVMGWYAQLGRAVLGAALPTGADRAMTRVMVHALQMRLGSFALRLRLDELHAAGTEASAARVRGQINRRIREAVEGELKRGNRGNFYQARFLAVLALVESSHFLVKARSIEDGDSVLKAELTAAGLALVGGSMEMLGLGATWTGERFSQGSVVARSSQAWGGRLRLYGGFLAGTAGVVMAAVDGRHAFTSFDERNFALGYAYAARALAISSAAFLGATVAFAGTASYLNLLMRRSNNGFLTKVLDVGSRWALRLSMNQARMLFLRTWGPRLGWVGLGWERRY